MTYFVFYVTNVTQNATHVEALVTCICHIFGRVRTYGGADREADIGALAPIGTKIGCCQYTVGAIQSDDKAV